MIRFAMAFFAFVVGMASLSAQSFDVAIPPKDGEKYKSAEFRLWIPAGLKTVRAVIVRQHGCGRNGIDHSDDLQWQTLAKKHDAALMGTRLVDNGSCAQWCVPANGSERAFLDALKALATVSKHAELTEVPWAIWGHSGGAVWGCHIANRYPDRVVGVWARSGAIAEIAKATLGVPIVYNYGQRESVPKNQFEAVYLSSIKAFETYRPQGALWSLAVDPKSWHDCRNSRALAVIFFDELLKERLPKSGVKLGTLKDDATSWRANAKTLEIGEAGAAVDEPKTTCWLPSKAYAAAWVEYCKTGDVLDTTPPSAPFNVKAATSDKGTTLTWQADADLESGTKAFLILRDGKTIATVGSPKTRSNPQGQFQSWEFGDEPSPRIPAMLYLDADGKPGAKYEVIQVNHANRESKPATSN